MKKRVDSKKQSYTDEIDLKIAKSQRSQERLKEKALLDLIVKIIVAATLSELYSSNNDLSESDIDLLGTKST